MTYSHDHQSKHQNTPPPGSRVGVLLFNLGGPETLDDVYPFLLNLFSDPEIFRVPRILQPLIARIVARRRAPTSRSYYSQIGGGSPLRRITNDQALSLEKHLNSGQSGRQYKVAVAMRYAPPRIEEALVALDDFRPDHLLFLPLYPQRSKTTTRSSFTEALDRIAKGFPRLAALPRTVIPAYPVESNYIAALSGTIAEKILEVPEDEGATILFSAHGIPEFMVTKEGDPYQKDTESTCQAAETYLRRQFPHRKLIFSLAYQSRVGPLKWLGPETRSTIVSLADNGTSNLILVPVSFVSDHQETLYEMDILYRDLASTLPLKRFLRAPALNTRADFISGLQILATSALSGEKTSCQDCSCNCGACP